MEEKIKRLLTYHPGLRVKVIAYVLHTTNREAGDLLEEMRKAGIVKRELIYGAYFYRMNNEPKT